MEDFQAKKNEYTQYYKNRFKDYFSPALLDYHIEKIYNQAAKTYSPAKGTTFQTHLASQMQQLNRVAVYKGGTLKQTEYSKQLAAKIKNEYEKQKVLTGKEPSYDDIAKKLKIPVDKVKNVMDVSVHAAIVPGKDFKRFDVNPEDFIGGLQDKDKKIMEAITQDMPLDKALKHTGLGKSQFYEKRKQMFNKIRESYIKVLRETHDID